MDDVQDEDISKKIFDFANEYKNKISK